MTIGMEVTDNEPVQLTEQNYRSLCRLCLSADDDCIVDVFSRCEDNAAKQPLIDRLHELYQVKLRKDDGLPTKVCHGCMYNTQLFYEFRNNVHSSERKLRQFIQTLAIHPVDVEEIPLTEPQPAYIDPDEANDVIVIDPSKCYETSDEEDDDDVVVVNPNPEADARYEHLATMYNRLALPPNAIETPTVANTSNSIDACDSFRNISFCKYCEAAFKDRQQCEAHEKNNHDPVSPFACNFCSFRCDSRSNVIAHIKQYHEPEKPYICVQCNKNFGRRADLKKHAVMHTGVRPYECSLCTKSFSRKSNLLKHFKTHGQQATPVEPPKPYQCEICSLRFVNHDELNEHQRQHIQERYAQLQMGAWNQMQQQLQQQHIQLQQQQLLQQQALAGKIAQGAIPPVTSTPTKGAGTAAAEPKYSIQCTMSPATDGSNIPKLKLTKKIQKFACDKCEKAFGTPTSLKSHKRVHAIARSLACTICNKQFKTKRELQQHNLTHKGEKKKFQCSVCPKSFLRRDKLVRHEKIHKNRKKTDALPESAFYPENLKRTSQFYSTDNRPGTAQSQQTPVKDQSHLQPFTAEMFRPQFYAEYDLSQT